MNRHLSDMSHTSHIDDLVDAYTLGALDADEVDLVERHSEMCARCQDLVTSSRRTADVFLVAPPPLDPPPNLRGRDLARIHAEVEPARGASPEGTIGAASTEPNARPQAPELQRVPVAQLLPGILSCLRQVLFGRERGGRDRGDAIGALLQQLLAEPDCALWEVGGTTDAPQARARLVATRSGHDAVLLTRGLPPAGPGSTVARSKTANMAHILCIQK